jgi:hypothetical protein
LTLVQPSPGESLSSAIGAAFIISLGQRPRFSWITNALALKARFIPRAAWVVSTGVLKRAFSALFIVR